MSQCAAPSDKTGWWARLKRKGRRAAAVAPCSDRLPADGPATVTRRHASLRRSLSQSLRPRRSTDDAASR